MRVDVYCNSILDGSSILPASTTRLQIIIYNVLELLCIDNMLSIDLVFDKSNSVMPVRSDNLHNRIKIDSFWKNLFKDAI